MPQHTPEEQLAVLRDASTFWGTHHEAQFLQIRYWICLAVPECNRQAQATVDPERYNISFVVTVPEGHQADEILLEGLGRSVRYLLGDHWSVSVRDAREGGWSWTEQGTTQQPPTRRRP